MYQRRRGGALQIQIAALKANAHVIEIKPEAWGES
jgi:hypothetical protein